MNETIEKNAAQSTKSANTLSRADRIQALNTIDSKLVTLLRLAGEATQALADPTQGAENQQRLPLPERKDAFLNTASEYYRLLSEVDVTLRRQILALEEAKIIPAQAPRDIVAPAGKGLKKETPSTAPEAGSLGNLDVGWLNSRNDRVGKEMEAELWTHARELIERLNAERAQDPDKMDSL